ncbi:hypothetical protein LTR08_005731 [Meristemomyces frigidus]|nr:hypothetical protein LTR08_005731 [Meristemomyces frigidus]
MGLAGISQADTLPSVEDFDYTRSHRAVPVPPSQVHHTAATTTPQSNNPARFIEPPPSRSRDQEEEVVERPGGRRRGSFGFMRRNPSQQHPPLPSTTAATPGSSYRERAISPSENSSHARNFFASRKASGSGEGMMRKSSKMRQQQAHEAALAAQRAPVPKQAPLLPSLDPLQALGTFGGDDARPDSVAIFNHAYAADPHNTPSHLPRRPSPPNFSRPGAMPSASANHSSSPSYAIRQGNAFAQAAAASSSPSVSVRGVHGEHVADQSHRSESMTNRGRYSYASNGAQASVNSPRRVRRRKDPTPFNALVIGAKNSGKSSFISFLRHSLAIPDHQSPHAADQQAETTARTSKGSFTSHFLETEMDGERIGVTLWDSAGLEKHIIDLQLREIASFVESKFEETFVEEQKVMRSPGAKDTHIHCVFLILDPVRLDSTIAGSAELKKGGVGLANASGLDDDLDLQVMRALWGKTTVIPVISKADTLTTGHMGFLKRAVWDSLKDAKLDPLEALELEGDEEEDDDEEDAVEDSEDSDASSGHHRDVADTLDDTSSATEADDSDDAPLPKPNKSANNPATHARHPSLAATAAANATPSDELPYLPMSILSPDPYDLPPYAKPPTSTKTPPPIGRRFPWGLASPYDAAHCDFTRLRDSVFSEWRGDLRDLARTKWYENWRTSRLKNLPGARQRVRGGVTPVGAVPREGRMSPRFSRDVSAGAQVPRSVSGGAGGGGGSGGGGGGGDAVPGAGKTIGEDTQSLASHVAGGAYKGVETYQ